MSGSVRPQGLQPSRLLCPWDSPGKNTGSGLPRPPPRDLPDPGIEPMSPALAGRFVTAELPRGVSSSNKGDAKTLGKGAASSHFRAFEHHLESWLSPRSQGHPRGSDSGGLRGGLRHCVSNKCPGDADAAGPGTPL